MPTLFGAPLPVLSGRIFRRWIDGLSRGTLKASQLIYHGRKPVPKPHVLGGLYHFNTKSACFIFPPLVTEPALKPFDGLRRRLAFHMNTRF